MLSYNALQRASYRLVVATVYCLHTHADIRKKLSLVFGATQSQAVAVAFFTLFVYVGRIMWRPYSTIRCVRDLISVFFTVILLCCTRYCKHEDELASGLPASSRMCIEKQHRAV